MTCVSFRNMKMFIVIVQSVIEVAKNKVYCTRTKHIDNLTSLEWWWMKIIFLWKKINTIANPANNLTKMMFEVKFQYFRNLTNVLQVWRTSDRCGQMIFTFIFVRMLFVSLIVLWKLIGWYTGLLEIENWKSWPC